MNQRIRNRKDSRYTCLLLKSHSQHVLDRKKLCNLSRFQEVVYSEAVDLVWVTETWLTKDATNTGILHDDYAIYRKDREPRTGGEITSQPRRSKIEILPLGLTKVFFTR